MTYLKILVFSIAFQAGLAGCGLNKPSYDYGSLAKGVGQVQNAKK